MLHQISWFTYTVGVISIIFTYYLVVCLSCYHSEIRAVIYKWTGRQLKESATHTGDLHIPDYDIMGQAKPDMIALVAGEELSFAPEDHPDEDEQVPAVAGVHSPDSRLISDFSEMVSEAKTLIRVINESNESKENFEMLFRLIAQKYPELQGTAYQEQINDFLLNEGAPEFPFLLDLKDLNHYWTAQK